MSRARAAFSRKRAPKSAVPPSSPSTSSSSSSAVDQREVGRGRLVGVGQVEGDAVVAPDGVGLLAGRRAQPRSEGQRPGGVDPRPEGRQHAQAPVADLVAEPLDHDRAVARHGPGGRGLVLEVGDEVGRGAPVEARSRPRSRAAARSGPAATSSRASRPTASPSSYGPPDALALPERNRPRRAGGRGHDHPVAGDLLDAPGGGAQHEGLARCAPRRPSPRPARPPGAPSGSTTA